MSMAARPLGNAMYIATEDDRLWLQSVQRKLYARSREHPDYVFAKLWGLVTDPRNLRMAFSRVRSNRGARTAGVDRVTVRKVVQTGVEPFLVAVREQLRSGFCTGAEYVANEREPVGIGMGAGDAQKTAAALGLTISRDVLLLADEVIE